MKAGSVPFGFVWCEIKAKCMSVVCLTDIDDHGEFDMPNRYGCLMSNQIQLYYSYVAVCTNYITQYDAVHVHAISSCLLPNHTEVIKAFLQLSASQATSTLDRVSNESPVCFFGNDGCWVPLQKLNAIFAMSFVHFSLIFPIATNGYNGFCVGFVLLTRDSRPLRPACHSQLACCACPAGKVGQLGAVVVCRCSGTGPCEGLSRPMTSRLKRLIMSDAYRCRDAVFSYVSHHICLLSRAPDQLLCQLLKDRMNQTHPNLQEMSFDKALTIRECVWCESNASKPSSNTQKSCNISRTFCGE